MELQQYWNDAYGAIIEFGPRLLSGLLILFAACVVGYLLSKSVTYLSAKLSKQTGLASDGESIGHALASAVFWIVILIALPAALGAMGMQGLLQPMQSMAKEFLGFVPNLIGAALIFAVGWIVATVAKRATMSILQSTRADALFERVGLDADRKEKSLSNFAGVLVFTLIIIPVAISALDALNVSSVSAPAKAMLEQFLNAIPNIFAAGVLIVLTYIIGRFASTTTAALLPTLGVDKVADELGFKSDLPGAGSISGLAGYIVFAAIFLFGLIEAAKLLNFQILSELLTELITLGARILFGGAIILFGVFAARYISAIVEGSKGGNALAGFVKVAIIILATAIGLRHMGVANEIIHLAFGLGLGALAVGAAIAIGLGGRETAQHLLEQWSKKL